MKKTQYLTVGEGQIAYDDQGAGPLIVCVPAAGDLRSEYRFLTPLLVEAGYRVVTMDVRGQGESSARWREYTASAIGSDILALIRHLNGGPAIVIAVSKATGAALWASVEAPSLIRGLVLIGIFAHAVSPMRAVLMARIVLAQPWGVALYASYFPSLYPLRRPADFDEHLAEVKTMLKEPGRLHALTLLFSDTGSDWDARVSKVSVPVLILMGSRDRDVKDPREEAGLLAERLQAAPKQVIIIEGAGRHLPAEVPEEVQQHVLHFLAVHELAAIPA
jgi:pimeloyl-ACP methyl ester carboxylesterase